MKFFHLQKPAQSTKQIKTKKKTNNKIYDTVFTTWGNIFPQLLKTLVVGITKRVFEVNRKKISLYEILRPCVLEKMSISDNFP